MKNWPFCLNNLTLILTLQEIGSRGARKTAGDLVATVAVFVRPSVDPKATAAEKGGVTVLSGLRMYLQRNTTVASKKVGIMSWLEISTVYHTMH